jgi:succinoglycan biosynthesis protein ExoM
MRPSLLEACLRHLLAQETTFPYEVIVVDNDAQRSAESIVGAFQREAQNRNVLLRYFVEPQQNIALARNRGVGSCLGKFVAFIDDDEYPARLWLQQLYETLCVHCADGVFGPVLPEFSKDFPVWLARSGIFDRPRVTTGTILAAQNLRSGNALLALESLKLIAGPFDKRLGKTGGEDSKLFRQLHDLGHSFCWCDEAVVYEIQDKQRARLSWHLARSYRGGWCFAKDKCFAHGFIWGALIVVVVALLGTARTTYKSILKFRTPKVAALILCQGIAGQLGKLGYFFGLSIEPYKVRPLP